MRKKALKLATISGILILLCGCSMLSPPVNATSEIATSQPAAVAQGVGATSVAIDAAVGLGVVILIGLVDLVLIVALVAQTRLTKLALWWSHVRELLRIQKNGGGGSNHA